jgi:cytochrome c oxidase assembly protein subunit 11
MAERANNLRTAVAMAGLALTMAGVSFAAVPLYRWFCQVTGYGGTTQRAERAPEQAGERWVTVRFDANVSGNGLLWRFEPLERSVRVRVGEERIVFYRATNEARVATTGTATFNVTPHKVGGYFQKIACFCFQEQTLEPGQSMDMPVSFFVDPALFADRSAADVTTITLSYTFFRAREQAPRAAANSTRN